MKDCAGREGGRQGGKEEGREGETWTSEKEKQDGRDRSMEEE